MAEEEIPNIAVSNSAEVETVEDDDAGLGSTTDTNALDTARAQAEARRKRILEKAGNRMKYVNGEQVQGEEEKKTSRSNAARIRAARQRRYGKKSAAAASAPSATTATPATEDSAAVEAFTSIPVTEPEKVEQESPEEKDLEAAASEDTASAEETRAPATATEPTTKKKYVGVAKMRRKMLVKKKMEEENIDHGASSTADRVSAKASLASDGKSSKGSSAASTTAVGNVGLPPLKVQIVPIYMHMIVILLLFVAGFDVGIQQFHVDVDVRTQVAVREYGVPFVQRNPWHPLKPIATGKDNKATLEEKIGSSSSISNTRDLQDEFGDDTEYIPPNIDPIFGVDLDDMTKGSGFLNQMARGAISIHRLLLWIFYYAPVGFLGSILSIPAAFIQSPPALFLVAVVLRQVVGHAVLGASIPGSSGDDGSDGKKQNSIEVLSMAKNFVKNFFMTTFPTVVKLYDAYLHLKADMYVVLCGVFFGLAWTHLYNDALSCDADVVVGDSGIGIDGISEGEL